MQISSVSLANYKDKFIVNLGKLREVSLAQQNGKRFWSLTLKLKQIWSLCNFIRCQGVFIKQRIYLEECKDNEKRSKRDRIWKKDLDISPGNYFKDKFCISSPIIQHLTPKITQKKKSQSNCTGLKSKQVIKADRNDKELPY